LSRISCGFHFLISGIQNEIPSVTAPKNDNQLPSITLNQNTKDEVVEVDEDKKQKDQGSSEDYEPSKKKLKRNSEAIKGD
jgi:hypothetical protein